MCIYICIIGIEFGFFSPSFFHSVKFFFVGPIIPLSQFAISDSNQTDDQERITSWRGPVTCLWYLLLALCVVFALLAIMAFGHNSMTNCCFYKPFNVHSIAIFCSNWLFGGFFYYSLYKSLIYVFDFKNKHRLYLFGCVEWWSKTSNKFKFICSITSNTNDYRVVTIYFVSHLSTLSNPEF